MSPSTPVSQFDLPPPFRSGDGTSICTAAWAPGFEHEYKKDKNYKGVVIERTLDSLRFVRESHSSAKIYADYTAGAYKTYNGATGASIAQAGTDDGAVHEAGEAVEGEGSLDGSKGGERGVSARERSGTSGTSASDSF